MKKGRFYDELLALTKSLVSIPSVSPSAGENTMAETVYDWIRRVPYFEEYPGQVWMEPVPGDPLGRNNVFALLKGAGDSDRTVICHGHLDTVPYEDYGTLKEKALSCDDLPAALAALSLPEDMKKDLASGEWLFGRGACDMKSGDAILMVLLKYLTEHREQMEGNVLFLFTCDEEAENNGMMAAVPVISDILMKEGLTPVLALNNDYVGPLYEGDSNRYVYTGTVGKVLASFYVLGVETHVGRIFEGVSAAAMAARLTEAIDSNPDLSDSCGGEFCQPPALLKLKDMKEGYNVQTARSAFLYFNVLLHEKEVKTVLTELKDIAAQSLSSYLEEQEKKSRAFSAQSGSPMVSVPDKLTVLTYDELSEKARAAGIDPEKEAAAIAEKSLSEGMDKREIACRIVAALADAVHLRGPAAVLFLAPPYCPGNTMRMDLPHERKARLSIERLARECAEETGEKVEVRHFFPCISDASYVKIDDSDESVQAIENNLPALPSLYPIPIRTIRRLSIPAVNMGVYGKGAHTWQERLYLPYSFNILPELILNTILAFSGDEKEEK